MWKYNRGKKWSVFSVQFGKGMSAECAKKCFHYKVHRGCERKRGVGMGKNQENVFCVVG